MSAIGPGSLLLCVDGSIEDPDCPLIPLVNGRVYECVALESFGAEQCSACGSDVGVTLAEFPANPDWAYCTCQFVPAGRRGDFTGLLTPADAPSEREGVDA